MTTLRERYGEFLAAAAALVSDDAGAAGLDRVRLAAAYLELHAPLAIADGPVAVVREAAEQLHRTDPGDGQRAVERARFEAVLAGAREEILADPTSRSTT